MAVMQNSLPRTRAYVDVVMTEDGFLEEETARLVKIDYDSFHFACWVSCLICGELADEIRMSK